MKYAELEQWNALRADHARAKATWDAARADVDVTKAQLAAANEVLASASVAHDEHKRNHKPTGDPNVVEITRRRLDDAKAVAETARTTRDELAAQIAERDARVVATCMAMLDAESAAKACERSHFGAHLDAVATATEAHRALVVARDDAERARNAAERDAADAEATTTPTTDSLEQLTRARREAQRQADAFAAAGELARKAEARLDAATAAHATAVSAAIADALSADEYDVHVRDDVAQLAALEVQQHAIAQRIATKGQAFAALAKQHPGVALFEPRTSFGQTHYPIVGEVGTSLARSAMLAAIAHADAVRKQRGIEAAPLDRRYPSHKPSTLPNGLPREFTADSNEPLPIDPALCGAISAKLGDAVADPPAPPVDDSMRELREKIEKQRARLASHSPVGQA